MYIYTYAKKYDFACEIISHPSSHPQIMCLYRERVYDSGSMGIGGPTTITSTWICFNFKLLKKKKFVPTPFVFVSLITFVDKKTYLRFRDFLYSWRIQCIINTLLDLTCRNLNQASCNHSMSLSLGQIVAKFLFSCKFLLKKHKNH